MQDIPRWIGDYIIKKSCSCGKCKMLLNEKHLTSIGIKYSYKNPIKEALFIELTCIKCGFVTKYEIRYMLLVELSLDIIQELQEQQQEEEMNKENSHKEERHRECNKELNNPNGTNDKGVIFTPKKDKSKITLKEIRDSSKFLQSIKTHGEMLEAMGMNPEEIDQYNDFAE